MAKKLARVLIDYEGYKPNDLIEAEDKEIKALSSQGVVDDNAEAVKYAKQLKAEEAK